MPARLDAPDAGMLSGIREQSSKYARMISVICVYNDKAVLERYLLNGLERQTVKGEVILLDNTCGRFSSAAEALNFGGGKGTSEYLMFIHQDVLLPSPDWLARAESYLDSIPRLGIAGVAGMVEGGRFNEERGRNIIKHGDPPEVWRWGHPITKPEPVQTLDELLVIIPKSVFDENPFDEATCSGWDLYAVDYCLCIRRAGFEVCVIPLPVNHGSRGRATESYFVTLDKVLKKHKNYYRRINTTIDSWSTQYPLAIQRRIKPLHKKFQRALRKAASLVGIF